MYSIIVASLIRTGKYLKDLYGLQWREKLSPIPVVRKEDIPVIVSDGGTSNQGSSSQGSQNVAIATGKSPETPTKSQEELFQEMKSLGNTAVQKVCLGKSRADFEFDNEFLEYQK